MDALLGQRHLGALAANDPGAGSGAGNSDDLANRRLELELGYGFSVLDDRGVATPWMGLSRSATGQRWRLGQRLRLGQVSEWRLESALGEGRAQLGGRLCLPARAAARGLARRDAARERGRQRPAAARGRVPGHGAVVSATPVCDPARLRRDRGMRLPGSRAGAGFGNPAARERAAANGAGGRQYQRDTI